jgi:hypothetical protein
MKARILSGWFVATVLAGRTVVPGLAQDTPASTAATVSADKAAAAAPSLKEPTTPNKAEDKTLRPTVYASPWLLEVERLSQAGVDTGVVLTYVFNCAGTFNLTADQIIHLKDAGISAPVINAMIQHDQQIALGIRPVITTAAPPPSPEVQAAIAARLPAAQITAAPPAAAPADPTPVRTSIIANDESQLGPDWVLVELDDVPDQPASLGPVRAPYPVKLNDPIIVLRLPAFTVPYW